MRFNKTKTEYRCTKINTLLILHLNENLDMKPYFAVISQIDK